VVIGDDVFIGTRVTVLPGSTIGSGSVIGAGSVVSGNIPSGVVAAGNPCRVIRSLSTAGP
jgi:acetyltransferase-like isoleucine patch superfamily enzyme